MASKMKINIELMDLIGFLGMDHNQSKNMVYWDQTNWIMENTWHNIGHS